jgi:hypothetical protein
MKRHAFAIALLAVCIGNAQAEHVIPAGTTLTAHISLFAPPVAKAEIQAPAKVENTWDRIAAQYAGCSAEGKVGHTDLAAERTYIQFDALKCGGKPPVGITAIAVSPVDHINGLPTPVAKKNPVPVKTPVTIVLMKTAQSR